MFFFQYTPPLSAAVPHVSALGGHRLPRAQAEPDQILTGIEAFTYTLQVTSGKGQWWTSCYNRVGRIEVYDTGKAK